MPDDIMRHYSAAARTGQCCDNQHESQLFGVGLYPEGALESIPTNASARSMGCGVPTQNAQLKAGETVLDLGSGGGIDVLLAAEVVGPSGFVYGLDLNPDMLALARANAAQSRVTNVEFLHGAIENIPLDANTIDLVISNCVINLSKEKSQAIAEIFRVLAPGGRISISDIIAKHHLTVSERAERGSHAGCIAGALSDEEYVASLTAAGFTQIDVQLTHPVADGMHAATIRATKP